MQLREANTDEKIRLIQSLFECVNSPVPQSAAAADAPFAWALRLTRERKMAVRQRIEFKSDDPGESKRAAELARSARALARGILWWLAVGNDQLLDEPKLQLWAGRPSVVWGGLSDVERELLESPLEFRHFVVVKNEVIRSSLAIWDRPSTCIGHALALLLSDYRNLRSKVRACPYLDRGDDLSQWKADQIRRDPTLHFFVDDRFMKGQVQYYCTPKHRDTAYMRRYRSDKGNRK